jgi:sterol desaturase/sphingolipid hydroxylase (fatty acid hydroxylase superfamily)
MGTQVLNENPASGLTLQPLGGWVSDDVLALVLILALVGFAIVELRKPYLRPGMKVIKNSYLTNVSLFLFNDITLSVLSIPALFLAAQQFAGIGLLSRMPDTFGKYLISFVLLDLAMFGWHYLTHHSDWLWKFHKVHHSDMTLNVTTGLRFHLAELLMEAMVRVVFIALIGVDAGVVLFTQTLISIFVLFHHTNITFPNEERWAKIFIVPRLHRVHHSVLREEHDSNYGAVFSCWDRLFGTLREQEPVAIGLADAETVNFKDILTRGFRFRTHEIPVAEMLQGITESIHRGHYLRRPAYAPSGDKQSGEGN